MAIANAAQRAVGVQVAGESIFGRHLDARRRVERIRAVARSRDGAGQLHAPEHRAAVLLQRARKAGPGNELADVRGPVVFGRAGGWRMRASGHEARNSLVDAGPVDTGESRAAVEVVAPALEAAVLERDAGVGEPGI